jgi:beta-N-acetylhexosaminidase
MVVGLPGPEVTAEERAVLEEVRPVGVILFGRNVEGPEQVRRLVEAVGELEPRPFVCIDLEGGCVNRLQPIWGPLPSPAAAAAAGRRAIKALGEAAGAACRALGVHLDLAPVVDLERPGGFITEQGRSLAASAERSATLARLFTQGLGSWQVGACLKHFPGLGPVAVDTHEALPVVNHRAEDLDEHLGVFAALAQDIPVVMVGHIVAPALGETTRPASLSRRVVQLATDLPGRPVVIADDLEMGALEAYGDLPELVTAALVAHNHGVLVCSAFDRLPGIAEHLREHARLDSKLAARIEEGRSRLGTLARDLQHNAAAVPAPDFESVAQLWERARREAGV